MKTPVKQAFYGGSDFPAIAVLAFRTQFRTQLATACGARGRERRRREPCPSQERCGAATKEIDMGWVASGVEPEKESALFMLDANVDVQIVRNTFQGLGLRIVELPPEMRRHPAHRGDPKVLAEAYRRGAFLVTHDRDFLDTEEYPKESNAGVIVIPGGSGDVDNYLYTIGYFLVAINDAPAFYRSGYFEVNEDGTVKAISEDPDTGELGYDKLRINDDGEIEVWFDDDVG
ncbi:MAG: hypothetical protein ACYC8W_07650 [Candidatus Tyrphobacter sp.]